ncbi:MAG: hypothetical protein HQL56_09970 [Magnetococcales bacterium]|nr:hypothetical protein [Magnetococcales bacterium]
MRLRWILLLLLVVFLGWRLVRPLNIFVVGDRFALPIVTTVPEGLKSLRASECGECHREIYEEWSGSIHAAAWTEEYFVADRAFEKNPPVCDNCHIQLTQQRPGKVVGFSDSERLFPITEPNPDYDPQLQNEGVTCAVCHVREGRIIGPYETSHAPHPVTVDPAFLSGNSPCKICHDVPGNRWDMFYRKQPCGTMEEIAEGKGKPDCVGCHLPRINRPLVEGGVSRPGGRHLFQGGHHPPMVKKALSVVHHLEDDGSRYRLVVTLTNTGTHHYLPTGTPDRHLILTMRLLDKTGRVVKEERQVMKRRILWRPFIVDLWDNRLPFNEPREYALSFDHGEGERVEVEVSYHLMEESRRLRIGYQNTQPIAYPVYQENIVLDPFKRSGPVKE